MRKKFPFVNFRSILVIQKFASFSKIFCAHNFRNQSNFRCFEYLHSLWSVCQTWHAKYPPELPTVKPEFYSHTIALSLSLHRFNYLFEKLIILHCFYISILCFLYQLKSAFASISSNVNHRHYFLLLSAKNVLGPIFYSFIQQPCHFCHRPIKCGCTSKCVCVCKCVRRDFWQSPTKIVHLYPLLRVFL